jgi:DNA-binding response OmpR family regulator
LHGQPVVVFVSDLVAVLWVDPDRARARRIVMSTACDGCVVSVANSLPEALVLVAAGRFDLLIVTLGNGCELRTSAAVLHAIRPDLRILFTGDLAPDADAIAMLDSGEYYLPTLSHARLRVLLHRRPAPGRRASAASGEPLGRSTRRP